MIPEEIRKYITKAVKREVRAYLDQNEDMIYMNISKRLIEYYQAGASDEILTEALDEVTTQKYFDVIPMYYRDRVTIERIAERFGVDVSTIVRNKRRICLDIQRAVENA